MRGKEKFGAKCIELKKGGGRCFLWSYFMTSCLEFPYVLMWWFDGFRR